MIPRRSASNMSGKQADRAETHACRLKSGPSPPHQALLEIPRVRPAATRRGTNRSRSPRTTIVVGAGLEQAFDPTEVDAIDRDHLQPHQVGPSRTRRMRGRRQLRPRDRDLRTGSAIPPCCDRGASQFHDHARPFCRVDLQVSYRPSCRYHGEYISSMSWTGFR